MVFFLVWEKCIIAKVREKLGYFVCSGQERGGNSVIRSKLDLKKKTFFFFAAMN